MKEFNILAALGKELAKPKMEARTEGSLDPNRMQWPYLRYNELRPNLEYEMRFLPGHSEKNPAGYIKKQMYQFPYELDMVKALGWAKHKCHYAMLPSCYKPGTEDPIKEILRDIYDTAKADTERGEDLREKVAEDPDFKEFLQTICKTWTQILAPVMLFATCEETKTPDGKYTRYVNYLPDKKKRNILFRIFQINEVEEVREVLLPSLGEKSFEMVDDFDTEGVLTGAWNDAQEGLNVRFTHTNNRPKTYKFNPSDIRSPLPTEILEQIYLEENYPNLVKRELEQSLKTPEEMMNMLKSCPMSKKYLIPMGFIV